MFNWMRKLLNRKTKPLTGGRRSHRLPQHPSLRIEWLEDRVAPATHTWTGGAGGGDLSWGTAANWSGGAPTNSESGPIILNFPSVASSLKATIDNISGLNVDQINFTDSGYTIDATAATTLNLTGSTAPAVTDSVGGNNFNFTGSNLSINLNSTSEFQISAGGDIIASKVTGTGGLTKTGDGTLTLSNGANTYSGTTTINAGTVAVSADNALGATGAGSGTSVSSGGYAPARPGVELHGPRGGDARWGHDGSAGLRRSGLRFR